LLLFGGKGGVGKTTLSASAAVSLAESRPSTKVLILSTDPAHSLSDSLSIEVSDEMTPVPMKGADGPVNLYARQLSTEKLAAQFRQENGEIIKTIADRGTFFDHEDITDFHELSLPGLDEVMTILEVADLLARKVCDVLILDTAPTGHTLRLLALPDHMRRWLHVMDLMLQKHRYMAVQFARKKYVKDRCDRFLDKLGKEIAAVGALLRDQRVTRFVPVMTPEMMSFCETEALVDSLEKAKIPLREILVNRLVGGGECLFCRAEKRQQLQVLGRIKERFRAYGLVLVEKAPKEVTGLEALSALAGRVSDHAHVSEGIYRGQESLAGDDAGSLRCESSHGGSSMNRSLLQVSPSTGRHNRALGHDLTQGVESGLEFIVVGGKGGVGKTSIAASVGLNLADCFNDKNFLLFSTDPAHSLSDAFDMPIGDRITPVSANLSAYEINADQLFEKFKAGCREEIQVLFDRFVGSGMDIVFDREVMTELISLAPPGLDEIMALDAVMDIKEKGEIDVLVVDASPTGHLLRFLEMPALVREWLKAYFTVLMKYKGSVRLTKSVEKVLVLSRHVRRIQEQLTNREKTAFIGVTLPETMVLSETERLLSYVDRAGISCRHLVNNRVMPETACPACIPTRMSQESCMKTMHARFPHLCITQVPLFPHAVQGQGDLAKVVGALFEDGGKAQ